MQESGLHNACNRTCFMLEMRTDEQYLPKQILEKVGYIFFSNDPLASHAVVFKGVVLPFSTTPLKTTALAANDPLVLKDILAELFSAFQGAIRSL